MAVMELDREMVRGDTECFMVELTDVDPEGVTGLTLTLRRTAGEDPVAAQALLGDGVTYEGDNVWGVRLAPEQTAELPAGRYAYDLELRIGEDVYTILRGKYKLVQDVTW